jgi:hypothetical protein
MRRRLGGRPKKESENVIRIFRTVSHNSLAFFILWSFVPPLCLPYNNRAPIPNREVAVFVLCSIENSYGVMELVVRYFDRIELDCITVVHCRWTNWSLAEKTEKGQRLSHLLMKIEMRWGDTAGVWRWISFFVLSALKVSQPRVDTLHFRNDFNYLVYINNLPSLTSNEC